MKTLVTAVTLLVSVSVANAMQTGIASWYGKENRKTCTGKRTYRDRPAVAHRYLPIGSYVKITSLKNNKSVIAIVEDRGPFTKNRIVDLNTIAARRIDMIKRGVTTVSVEPVR